MDWVELAAVVALAGAASFAQALSGFGFSLLIVPPLALVVGPKEAVVMANLMGMMSSSLTLTSMHDAVDWRLAGPRVLPGDGGPVHDGPASGFFHQRDYKP